MSVFDLFLTGAALSADAVAVSMTNGMSEPEMPFRKCFLIAFFFGIFQAGMPLIGYYGSSALSFVVAYVAPWVSFLLLSAIGGKAIADVLRERKAGLPKRKLVTKKPLQIGTLLVQAIATSIDALAVGVSLLAQDTMGALPFHVVFCATVIGAVTFLFSAVAVQIGKTVGNALAEHAELIGGFVLVFIGIRLLLESIM